MKREQLGSTLFNFRDFCGDPEGVHSTLKRVADIGYKAIQISSVGDHTSEEQLRDWCGELGLSICLTHEPPQKILEDPQAVAERQQKLGCPYTAYPWPADVDMNKAEDVQKLIDGLNASEKVISAAGIGFAYHNHHLEFAKSGNSTAFERLFAETKIQAVLDIHWVQRGGACPVGWIRKLSGRVPILHLKDFALNEKFEPVFAVLGEGNLPLQAIVEAGVEAGTEWFVVEQDDCYGEDPFDCAARSFEYASNHLVDLAAHA